MASTLDLELPGNWEPMHDEGFKKVELQPNSPEYQDVAMGFTQTAKYNIVKVSMFFWNSMYPRFLNHKKATLPKKVTDLIVV